MCIAHLSFSPIVSHAKFDYKSFKKSVDHCLALDKRSLIDVHFRGFGGTRRPELNFFFLALATQKVHEDKDLGRLSTRGNFAAWKKARRV